VNDINVGIAIGYGILGGLVVLAIGAAVAFSTMGRRREIDAHKLGERERLWFAIVVVTLVVLLFATIFFTPYGRSESDARQEANVKAQQFAFVLDKTTFRAGEPVKFHLESADVNHGFAVYDEHNTFLWQAQVMPGKTQDYVYTFEKPGTYTVLCFEYCGVGHDGMKGTFTVEVTP
jgi:cytochrome c oxidase subunit 2